MTIYSVNETNWNATSFWSSVNPSGPSNSLNFAGLPSRFTVDFDALAGLVTISDGSRTFKVGDGDHVGPVDAVLGGATRWDFFAPFLEVARGNPRLDNVGAVCFTRGTAIRTPNGDRLIEDLQVGDLVCTLDNGPQPLMWVGARDVSVSDMLTQQNLRPVQIAKGAMGNARAILVSRRHAMLVSQDKLARAFHLSHAIPGVRTLRAAPDLTYVQLMFERHQIIFAENSPSESFYPSPHALLMMTKQARSEVNALLPNLNTDTPNRLNSGIVYGAPARPYLCKVDVWDWACAAMPIVPKPDLARAG